MKKDAADLYALALVNSAIKAQSHIEISANNAAMRAENICCVYRSTVTQLAGRD